MKFINRIVRESQSPVRVPQETDGLSSEVSISAFSLTHHYTDPGRLPESENALNRSANADFINGDINGPHSSDNTLLSRQSLINLASSPTDSAGNISEALYKSQLNESLPDSNKKSVTDSLEKTFTLINDRPNFLNTIESTSNNSEFESSKNDINRNFEQLFIEESVSIPDKKDRQRIKPDGIGSENTDSNIRKNKSTIGLKNEDQLNGFSTQTIRSVRATQETGIINTDKYQQEKNPVEYIITDSQHGDRNNSTNWFDNIEKRDTIEKKPAEAQVRIGEINVTISQSQDKKHKTESKIITLSPLGSRGV